MSENVRSNYGREGRGPGKYEREMAAEAIKNRDAEWNRILKEENAIAFQKRKRQVLLVLGGVLSTGAMVAFMDLALISDILAVVFSSGLAAVFGYAIRK